MADHIEIQMPLVNHIQVELGIENAFSAVERLADIFAERIDNGAAAAAELLGQV